MDDAQLKQRVRHRLKTLSRGAVEAAKIAGLHRDYLRDWFNGRKDSVKRGKLPQIAVACDWSLLELMDEQQGTEVDIDTNPPQITIELPEIELRAGVSYAGGFNREENTTDEFGNIVSRDAIRATWSFPRPFLRDEMHIRQGRAHILPVRGDSMMDALFDGDRAIIDLDDTDISQGGIFALVDDNGSVIIKQVQLVRGTKPSRIRCTSRNGHYEPFELVLDDPVKIVGRVACKITRL